METTIDQTSGATVLMKSLLERFESLERDMKLLKERKLAGVRAITILRRRPREHEPTTRRTATRKSHTRSHHSKSKPRREQTPSSSCSWSPRRYRTQNEQWTSRGSRTILVRDAIAREYRRPTVRLGLIVCLSRRRRWWTTRRVCIFILRLRISLTLN